MFCCWNKEDFSLLPTGKKAAFCSYWWIVYSGDTQMLKGTVLFPWAGLNLQRNGSSASPELPSEAKTFRPVLQPSESVPPIGIDSGKGDAHWDSGEVFIHSRTIYSFTNVCFVHRDLRAELPHRETLHQSCHGSGVRHHRAEGQRGTHVARTGVSAHSA